MDVVLDTIGGETLRRSIAVVKPGGVVVSLLGEPPQDEARARGIRAISNSVTQPFPSSSLLQTLAQLIVVGELAVTLGPTFALHEAPQAHQLSQTGHGRGRIVLHIAD
ncbi:MAG TPA: zinc-binding dehydrogenase [Roseiflexaceae bacterium]|nr:zinc-binding dehydrogenase [Roseiflexaceae bacterium]